MNNKVYDETEQIGAFGSKEAIVTKLVLNKQRILPTYIFEVCTLTQGPLSVYYDKVKKIFLSLIFRQETI